MKHYSTTKFTTRLIEVKLTTVEALLNGHSRKRTALLMAAMHHKTQFFSTPIQSQFFYIPVNDQLHLRTPFYRPPARVFTNESFHTVCTFYLLNAGKWKCFQ